MHGSVHRSMYGCMDRCMGRCMDVWVGTGVDDVLGVFKCSVILPGLVRGLGMGGP